MNNPSVAVALNTGEDIAFTNSLIKPELKEGEIYAGILLGKNGSADQHIILLPGDNDEADLADSTAWAESIGGELPTRREQSLLFANLKEEFQQDWYWSCETHAANADYAWSQNFTNGFQSYYHNITKLRARAVRRVTI